MRFLSIFFVLLICEQGSSTTYKCNVTASCGCSSPSTVLTRIVGGEAATHGTWTWAVSFREHGSHICGGSILTPLFIITAAHCVASVANVRDLSILAGSLTVTPSSSNKLYQTRSISKIYKHSDYNSKIDINDIAILRLSSPLDMTKGNLKPICLSTGTTVQPPNDIDMIAVGWGVTSMDSFDVSSILRQVTVKSISETVKSCKNALHDSRYHFCAGLLQGTKDTCQGDSGGPIMSFVNGLWQLDGLTSYGYGCALADNPGVYTRVSMYIDWIQAIIGKPTVTTRRPTRKTTTIKKSSIQKFPLALSKNITSPSQETLKSKSSDAEYSKIRLFFTTIFMFITISLL